MSLYTLEPIDKVYYLKPENTIIEEDIEASLIDFVRGIGGALTYYSWFDFVCDILGKPRLSVYGKKINNHVRENVLWRLW